MISVEKLKCLKVCKRSLYFLHRSITLYPVCEKGMLCDEIICPNCEYDGSSVE